MRAFIFLFVLSTLLSCSRNRAENPEFQENPESLNVPKRTDNLEVQEKSENLKVQKAGTFDEIALIEISAIDRKLPLELDVSVIDAKFPLKITEVDFVNKNKVVKLDDEIIARIEQTVRVYHEDFGIYDSSRTYKDAYINTIRLQDGLWTVFLVLLHHYITGKVNSQVLFYDNQKKEFAGKMFNFNLHALYDYQEGKLKPRDLKTGFGITSPEIALVDFDHDGVNDFKFTRLFHNGTANYVYTTILTIKDSKVEPLYFDSQDAGEWKGK